MRRTNFGSFTAVTALAVTCGLWGCVADRPSRNGVFNENQYIRKDFLIQAGDGSTQDQGWYVKSTILQTSTPNVLGYVGGAGLFAGAEGQTANFVRFQVTQDHLNVLDMRAISNDPTVNSQQQTTPEVVNTWPVTNVDLKYQINLDGEKTNFYQENQELDWQVRQWVKINFAKNDLSDLYAYGANTSSIIQNCTDLSNASATLVDGSFIVDEPDESFQYVLQLTIPISFSSDNQATCVAAFGPEATAFGAMGRQNVTINMLTSYVRPDKIVSPTYVPMPIAEKDPIQHKYGAFQTVATYRDLSSSLLEATQYVTRFDPNQPITYYFAPGMPAVYQQFFLGADKTGKTAGLAFQTNQVLAKAGGTGRLSFLNYNDATTFGDGAGPVRQYGDPRYSFINWHTDLDNSSGLLGIAQFFANPLNGELLSATVNVFEGAFQDTVSQRLQAFLQTVGAEYLLPNGSDFDNSKYPATCTDGEQIPLVPIDISQALNAQSTVYNKMQAQLQYPFADYGYLGPANFIPPHVTTTGAPDPEFYGAYYAIIPYQTYADPQSNQFVQPEGSSFATQQAQQWMQLQNLAQFQAAAGLVDQGQPPFDPDAQTGINDAVAWSAQWGAMSQAVTDQGYTVNSQMKSADDIGLFSYFDIYQKNGRHCVNGQWESLASYTTDLITSLNMAVAAHEFGHTMGLRHNFMGSVDQRNYPTLPGATTPALYSSSIMDYNQQIVEAFFESPTNAVVWGPYDAAAIGWIYGNNLSAAKAVPLQTNGPATGTGASGQVNATTPWNDPLGFQTDGKTEIPFLYCSDEHMKYTPLCRQYDMGATPAEITANAIQQREWNYLWVNFRNYHKYFNETNYATSVANDFNEMRRFSSQWTFDWSNGELTNDLRLIGVPVPSGATVADYYNELTGKFNTDISMANQLAVTYQRAIIDQSSGERPFITVFDPFYGDVTQQGIQIDKVQVTTNATENWLVTNFDPSQAAGTYLTSLAGAFGDAAYGQVAYAALNDFLGAAFATYSYTQVAPIANFAANSTSQLFSGNLVTRDWVGSWVFTRDQDFRAFVDAIAAQYDFPNCDVNGQHCAPCSLAAGITACTWDPRVPQATSAQATQSSTFNTFQAPDGRTYIWAYIQSRNEWVLADRDRNTATYNIILQFTTDVVNGGDDGYNGSLAIEKNVRWITDAYQYYNGQSLAAPGVSSGSGNSGDSN